MGATPRAKRNMDSGPPTALFSFDRDRERDMAERAAATRPEWLQARYRLIDEVLAYRRTGALTPDLLAACEAERKAAPWCRSQGLHRLVQLCADGHAVAATAMQPERLAARTVSRAARTMDFTGYAPGYWPQG